MPYRSFMIGTWLTALVIVADGLRTLPDGERQFAAQEAQPPEQLATAAEQRETALKGIVEKWTGDLDGMIRRGYVRVATVYSRTLYFIDKGAQRGAVYESFELFQSLLNQRLRARNDADRVSVVFLPVTHDELLSWVVEGRADLAAGGLTVTPEREKLVDFSPATRTDVSEIVVTGPGAPPIATADDLSGQRVFVRKSSSYYDSLTALNRRLKKQGKAEVIITPAPEALETEDILDMVNAGLVKITVADNYLVEFWQQILPSIRLHDDVQLRSGGHLAVAMRKNSPQLMDAATAWIRKYGPRTAFGNMMTQRYLKSTALAKSATSPADIERFHELVEIFRKYGNQYHLDPLLMAAQGYQESQLRQSARSAVGAIGVMQVTPVAAKEVGIGDITDVNNNIHAGVKYIRLVIDRYYLKEPMDLLNKGFFAFAAYNAGPAQIASLRREAAAQGLNPNIWFNNVERVASERIGLQTVNYVGNIYKYYITYQLAMADLEARRKVKARGT